MAKLNRFFARSWISLQIRLINIFHPKDAAARGLNNKLFSVVRAIPQGEMDLFEEDIRFLCSFHKFLPDYTENWVSHRFRFYMTNQWIQQIVKDNPNHIWNALELGGETLATDLLRKYVPQVTWKNTEGDLRYHWNEESQSVDLIVCTELLEHVSDLPEGMADSFRRTGLNALLYECFRVLKPGGFLLITTPNAGSIIHLEATLVEQPPWFLPLHVREYTVEELLKVLRDIGFQVVRWQTIHCLTIDYHKDYTSVFKMLLEYGYQVENRGDDIFLLVRT